MAFVETYSEDKLGMWHCTLKNKDTSYPYNIPSKLNNKKKTNKEEHFENYREFINFVKILRNFIRT